MNKGALYLVSALASLGLEAADFILPNDQARPCEDNCKISLRGVALVRQFEGFRACPYKDVAGFWTVGFGHLMKSHEDVNECLTLEEADRLLRFDIREAENAVNQEVKVPLTQEQYDALVSWTYNLGHDRLRRSTLLKKVNAGDFEAAEAEFHRWVYAGRKKVRGLVVRRKIEAALFGLSEGEKQA